MTMTKECGCQEEPRWVFGFDLPMGVVTVRYCDEHRPVRAVYLVTIGDYADWPPPQWAGVDRVKAFAEAEAMKARAVPNGRTSILVQEMAPNMVRFWRASWVGAWSGWAEEEVVALPALDAVVAPRT